MRLLVFGLAAVLVSGAVLVGAPQQSTQRSAHDHSHEVSDFVGASLQQCELAMASVEDIARKLADARSSNDVTRSRAALDAATRSVSEVRQHLGSCSDTLKLVPRERARPALRFTTTMATVLDVLCGVTMDAAATPTASHDGQQYFFCSEADRDEFQKDPARFLVEPHR